MTLSFTQSNRCGKQNGMNVFFSKTQHLTIRAMKYLFLFLAFTSLTGCSKKPQTWKVNYKVSAAKPGVVSFRVKYLTPSGATRQEGIMSDPLWISDTLYDFEEGRLVRLEVEVVSGDLPLDLFILRDGAIHKQGKRLSGQKTVSIEADL